MKLTIFLSLITVIIFLGCLTYRAGQNSIDQRDCEGIIYVASTCDD